MITVFYPGLYLAHSVYWIIYLRQVNSSNLDSGIPTYKQDLLRTHYMWNNNCSGGGKQLVTHAATGDVKCASLKFILYGLELQFSSDF